MSLCRNNFMHFRHKSHITREKKTILVFELKEFEFLYSGRNHKTSKEVLKDTSSSVVGAVISFEGQG